MTFKAIYRMGKNTFSFPTNLYLNGKFAKSVKNTEYKKIKSILTPFDSNEIMIFEGNDGGYFLTITHENEPVRILESFVSMTELDLFLNEKRKESEDFNGSLYENDTFFTYYLLKHVFNHSDPRSPRLHLLVRKVRTMEYFYLLFNCYESLYKKRAEYEERVDNKANREFVVEEFFEMLTENELSLFKFSIFCHTDDASLFDSSIHKVFLYATPDLKADAFEEFGISDSEIMHIFRFRKMHVDYFTWRIRDNKGMPSVFYFDNGVQSYLKPEDEVILWRKGKKFHEYLSNNYDSVCKN